MKQIRITWKSKVTGFQSNGEWFEDTIENKKNLDSWVISMNEKHKETYHWIEWRYFELSAKEVIDLLSIAQAMINKIKSINPNISDWTYLVQQKKDKNNKICDVNLRVLLDAKSICDFFCLNTAWAFENIVVIDWTENRVTYQCIKQGESYLTTHDISKC